MTDDRSKAIDEAWIEALQGGESDGAEDARLIRASLESQEELTSERITDEDLETAKQRLLERLQSEGIEAVDEEAKVVDLSAHRPEHARPSRWHQNPGILLAASVTFVAIVVIVLMNPNVPDGDVVIMSWGEIDTVRGAGDEYLYPVEDPDAFGRALGADLIERGIPFVLTADSPDSPERIISIQVDGVSNAAGVQETLDGLGLEQPSSSVVILRLVPE